MPTQPANPIRNLGIGLAVIEGVYLIQGVFFTFMDSLPQIMRDVLFPAVMGVGGVCHLVGTLLLFGLVLGCDRRTFPAVVFGFWMATAPLEQLQNWAEVPTLFLYGIYLLGAIAWAGILVAVAAAQSERALPVAGCLGVGVVLLGCTFALRWLSIDLEPLHLVLRIAKSLAFIVGIGVLATGAREPARLHVGWPLILLGTLPVFRVWLAFDVLLSNGPLGYIGSWMWARIGGYEVASIGLLLLAWWGISRRRVEVRPLVSAFLGSLGLGVLGLGMTWYGSYSYTFSRDYGVTIALVVLAASLLGLLATVLQIKTLRDLAARLESDRLVQRANAVFALMALSIVLAFGLVVSSCFRSGLGANVLLLAGTGLVALGTLFTGLALVGMWMFLCFGLAKRLDTPEGDAHGLGVAS